MDTFQHAVHGSTIVALPAALVGAVLGDAGWLSHATTFVSACFALIGATPDLAGEFEVEEPGESKRWNWHVEAHAGALNDWFRRHWYLVFPLPWILHTWLDTMTHGEGKRWWKWNERLWLELVSWAVTIGLHWVVLK